jgi:Zn finger protein HypA/HybF involved in hydrogenase expression
MAIDNVRFIAGAARILAAPKELKSPYQACIATFGSEEHVEKVVVSIVDMTRRLVIDHRTWFISEYSDEASRSVEAAMDVLTDDVMNYCERSRVGKVSMIDKPFPLQELEEKCPHCGEEKVRVPWHDR